MGSGKTTAAIDYINNLPEYKRVIFITPFLSEIDRIVAECPNKNIRKPEARHGRGTKTASLLILIQENRNIASTHSLLKKIDDKILLELKSKNYILILDEAFDVVQQYDFRMDSKYSSSGQKEKLINDDIRSFIDKGFIAVKDNYLVEWIGEKYRLSKYDFFINLVKRKSLYLINKTFLLWVFPPEIFSKDTFEEIFILTFQFEYQIQCYYYKYFGIEYDLFHVEDDGWGDEYNFVKTENGDYEIEWIKKVAPLIRIEKDKKLNSIGSFVRGRGGKSSRKRSSLKKSALSKNWYKENPQAPGFMKNNIRNFFEKISKKNTSLPQQKMWTCFKDHQKKIMDGRITKSNWVALNSRATNIYRKKTILAYSVNRYINPFVKQFFAAGGVEVDDDKLALSELIQWIFRSAVRDGKKVDLYIPSERMRLLLKEYLEIGKEV